ncbi:MAG: hypothetical protein ACR2FY_02745 [Pirellulaceae bacterium]
MPSMSPAQFIAKWQAVNLSERSACQQHFLDLCELLGQPMPAAADPEGAWYCFEKGVKKTQGHKHLLSAFKEEFARPGERSILRSWGPAVLRMLLYL